MKAALRSASVIKTECLGIVNIPNLIQFTTAPICAGQTSGGFMLFENGGIMEYESGGFMESEG